MDLKKRTILISPSGNLYGSEQVLLDFLSQSDNCYTVYVPRHSTLSQKLAVLEKHRLIGFDPRRLENLYFRIILRLIFGRIKSVYINEGGHIKYIRMLAWSFKSVKFTIHLRMIYDANVDRIGNKVIPNIQLLAISDYISKKVPLPWKCQVIYDPYIFSENSAHLAFLSFPNQILFKIGIIGRISETKGFLKAALLFEYLEANCIDTFEFNFFGAFSYDERVRATAGKMSLYKYVKVNFHGFSDKETIYSNIDGVCHFCEEEGLGRVFFEAIDWQRPFIGFRAGGLVEIAEEFQLNSFLIEKNGDWKVEFLRMLDYVKSHYAECMDQLGKAKKRFSNRFSVNDYLNKIENII